jgi:hypothetical protein
MPKKPEENSLLAALQFVSAVQPKRSNVVTETHCWMFGQRLVACAGPLSAGIPIQEEIEACPNTLKLIEALKQCPDAINLTMTTQNELSVRSGNFQATIPCIRPSQFPTIYPNPPVGSIPAEFLISLKQVGAIVSDKAKTIVQSSVKLMGESIIATNGDVILESWHGHPGPVGPIVPKLFISALGKRRDKAIYRIGGDRDEMTGYYDDGSWIKTLLQKDPAFPNLQSFLDVPVNTIPTPLGFFQAIDRLAKFSKDGKLYFTSEGICTDNYLVDGAINVCEGLPVGISFNIASLQMISQAEQLDFSQASTQRKVRFFGKNMRGVIGCDPL